MKSIKLKAFFLALGFFAVSSTFAQDDTTGKPSPDTSKLPKTDTTSLKVNHTDGSVVNSNTSAINASLTKNEDKVEAKKEKTEGEK